LLLFSKKEALPRLDFYLQSARPGHQSASATPITNRETICILSPGNGIVTPVVFRDIEMWPCPYARVIVAIVVTGKRVVI